MTAAVQHDQLLTALYSAAAVLIGAVTDPLALEPAPLRHRASALNAVSSLIATLHKSAPPAAARRPGEVTHIEWDFGPDPDEEFAEYDPQPSATGSVPPPTYQPVTTALAPASIAPVPVAIAPISSDYAPYHHDVAANVPHPRQSTAPAPQHADPLAPARRPDSPPVSAPFRVEAMSSLLDYDRLPA